MTILQRAIHLVQALQKAQTPITFPGIQQGKTSLADDRRETLVVGGAPKRLRERLYQAAIDRSGVSAQRDNPEGLVGGQTLVVHDRHTTNGPNNAIISYADKPSSAIHEDQHRLFGRITQAHGGPERRQVAAALFNSLEQPERDALQRFSVWKGYRANNHEEHIANLISYLNNPVERANFREETFGSNYEGESSRRRSWLPRGNPGHPRFNNTDDDPELVSRNQHALEHDQAMKRAIHHLRQYSPTLTFGKLASGERYLIK